MDAKPLYQILVLDDEVNIVNAVRRELSLPPLGHFRYEIEGFTDPAAALARAQEKTFDAVISDYRMPGMDGLAFLTALQAMQPECACLVLSGRTDLIGLIRLINETHIYRFIPKPWHDYFLKSSLGQAIDYAHELRENRRLAQLVHEHGIALSIEAEQPVERLLIVDDEPSVLSSLSRVLSQRVASDALFAAIQSEVTHQPIGLLDEGRLLVQVTTSPHQALAMAKEVSFACIIADYRMAEMNGVELLAQMAQEQPDCVRLLISGQINQEELIDAVDLAHIYGFIDKPWQDFELKATVAQALAWRRVQQENRTLAAMVKAAGGH